MKKNWSLDVNASITSQCAFLNNGMVFGTRRGKLLCVDFSGKLKWSYNSSKKISQKESLFFDEETISNITCTPLIFENNIYFGTQNGELHCISTKGIFLWKQKLSGAIRDTPSIALVGVKKEEILIIGTMKGVIHFITLKGKKKKKIDIGSPIESTPIILDDKIIVGCSDGKIVALNQSGLHLWTFQTKGKITANIVVSELFSDGDKSLLVGCQDNFLYAISLDGELRWKFETQGSIVSAVKTAHLSNDQRKDVLVGSCDNKLYCISAHGEKLWSYETDFWVVAPPAIINIEGSNKIFIGSYDQKIYALDSESEFNLSFMPGLVGIINQTGYNSMTTSRSVGEEEAKKIYEEETDGHIVSCVQIPDSPRLVVTTTQGLVYEFNLQ